MSPLIYVQVAATELVRSGYSAATVPRGLLEWGENSTFSCVVSIHHALFVLDNRPLCKLIGKTSVSS